MISEVRINGEIFSDYAFISYIIKFQRSDTNKRCDLFFDLPSGSVISSLKIIEAGKVNNAKIIPISIASEQMANDDAYAVLRLLKNDKYLLHIDSIKFGEISLTLSVYSPVTKNQLTLPLSGENIIESADIKLVARNVSLTSPTHELIANLKKDDETHYIIKNIVCDRDLSIKIKPNEKKNIAYISENPIGGEMLGFLYPDFKIDGFIPKINFIFKKEWFSNLGEFCMAKELVFYLSQRLDNGYSVTYSDKLISQNDSSDILLSKLDNIDEISELIENKASNTKNLYLIGTSPLEKDEISDNSYIISLGAIYNSIRFGSKITQRHFFENENIDIFISSVIEDLKTDSEIYLESGSGEPIILRGSTAKEIKFCLSYIGSVPKSFKLIKNNTLHIISFDDCRIYQTFAPTKLLYAKELCDRLEKSLDYCDIDEIPTIRENIEKIGISSSLINSETALVTRISGKKVTVGVNFRERKSVPDIFSKKTFFCRENDKPVNKLYLKKCVEYLILSVQSDGAITENGEVRKIMRKKETLFSVLAFIAMDKEKYASIIAAAENYLNGYRLSNVYFTKNKSEAKNILQTHFEKNDIFLNDGISLDIFSAVCGIAKYII